MIKFPLQLIFYIFILTLNWFTCRAQLFHKEIEDNGNMYRLPKTIIPISYDLTLYTTTENLETGNFTGTVNIIIEVLENVSSILLHNNKLEIDTISLNQKPVTFTIDEEYELLKVQRELTIGQAELSITFSGCMLDKLVGLYSSSYQSIDGSQRILASTKFEPTYARQAFPCFDEPNLKAYFTIHIIKPKDTDYIALSNMPVKSEVEVPEGIKVSFEESVKMPTYLACWVVSDFQSTGDFISSPNFDDIPFRVFASPAQLAKTEYAAFAGKKVMEYYLDYFKIAFPLPKLDMLAIPDYSSGATEHWGIITYRETSLLFDKNISTSVNQQRVATVIAHELAHSWFGNLVTMDWWNDLWLNEGFSQYIKYKGVNAIHPDWNMLDQFIEQDLHNVLKSDATLASHPIVQTVSTPNEITQLFNKFAYSKGGSILRMMENFISEDNFSQGVTNYLNKHAFSNAVTQDLLDELQPLVGNDLNLTEFLDTWTIQRGYPILKAKRIQQGFRLTQHRFFTDILNRDTRLSRFTYRWTIPVTYFTADDPESKLVWFNYNDKYIDVNVSSKYVKFNARQVGYYRVNYNMDDWKLLIDNIKDFSSADRAHLIEESFRIAESTLLTYDVPLNLFKYLEDELEYVPWKVASTMIAELKNMLRWSSTYNNYKQFVIKLVLPAVNYYTWNEAYDDDHLTKISRLTVLKLACSMGEEQCLIEAQSRLQEYLYENVKPLPNLKEIVYKFGMRNGNISDWEKMWDRYVDEIDSGEKNYLIQGLTAIQDESQLYKLLDLAKDDTYIRKQDFFNLILNIASNSLGVKIVWNYFRKNWDKLVERFGLNDRHLHNMIPGIVRTFATNLKMKELLDFYAENPEIGAGELARKLAKEHIQNNIIWLKHNKLSVENWLDNNL